MPLALSRRDGRRSLPSLAAALLLAALPAAFARADSPWLYGIHWYGDPNGSVVETMTGGKGIWSLEIVVPYSDPWWQAGGQLWKFEQIVARGHTIICRIEPNWGKAIPLPGEDFNQYLADVQATAALLANVVHIWQIGNEMNLNGEWGGNVLTAATYIDAFKQIRAAIQSVPSPLGPQIVLVGPVSPGGVQPGVRHTDGAVYLEQMCNLLEPEDFDGFAIHAYAAPWYNVTDSRNDLKAGYTSQLAVIDSAGFLNKPVYLTEWNRRVEPFNDANQAISAQFLHGALADLHAWNTTPGAHPIAAACWFIYAYDSGGWAAYSLDYMRGIGPTGHNSDPWDALQYACTQNYPAGYPDPNAQSHLVNELPPGVNVAMEAAATTSSNYNASFGGDKAIDGIISASSKWTSGSGVNPPHWIRLDLGAVRNLSGYVVRHASAGGEPTSYNTQTFHFQSRTAQEDWRFDGSAANPAQAGFTARRFKVTRPARYVELHISDPGIDAYARIPEFEVYATAPGDTDADGDTDLADYAVFAACLAGPQVATPPDDCPADAFLVADLEGDGDVDLADVAAFVAGFDGP
jgi:hypothetical protein